MKFIPTSIILNGIEYTGEALAELSLDLMNPGRQDWEHALGFFLKQWSDESETIVVNTSGSTGSPKPMALSKRSMLASASLTGTCLSFREGQTALLCLNARYIAGMMMVVRAMLYRMNLIIVQPGRSPLEHTNPGRIDFTAMVPAQLYNSLLKPETRKMLESFGTLIIGGAPLSRELEKMAGQLNGRIYATFGMTETITHIALRRINGPEKSELFTVLPGISVECDARGCLVATLPWLKGQKVVSNDLVRIESPGSFRWLGRIDNIINTGGIKLIPETIEDKIAGLVSQRFFIAALPDPALGELPVLVIESPGPLTIQQAEALRKGLTDVLETFEMPRRIISTVKFSETESGKINRPESLRNALNT